MNSSNRYVKNIFYRVLVKHKHFVISLLLILPFFCSTSPGGGGDTVPAELMPISIIQEQNLDFNEFIESGKKLPFTALSEFPYYFQKKNGNVLSAYPIIPGILNLPVFVVAKVIGVDIHNEYEELSNISIKIIILISMLFMYFCLKLILNDAKSALGFSLVYVFATCVWGVAGRALWQHGPSLLFFSIAFYCLLSKKDRLIPFSGFFLGMAVFNRPSNIIIALPLALYVLVYHRNLFLKASLWACIPAGLLAFYSYTAWGSIMALGQAQGQSGFVGKMSTGFVGLLFSPSRGLIIYSPIFIFSFIYLFYCLLPKKPTDPIYSYLGFSTIILIILYSKWADWWGGHSFGYRLIIELIPILILFLALAWEKWIQPKIFLRYSFYILLLISIFINYLGGFQYPCGHNQIVDRDLGKLWSVKDSQIVSCAKKLL